jgi:hypothetical protein
MRAALPARLHCPSPTAESAGPVRQLPHRTAFPTRRADQFGNVGPPLQHGHPTAGGVVALSLSALSGAEWKPADRTARKQWRPAAVDGAGVMREPAARVAQLHWWVSFYCTLELDVIGFNPFRPFLAIFLVLLELDVIWKLAN